MSSFKVLENDTGLQVTGLRKSYRKRIIIHDISLELRRGEVVALLGPNGSGKTTTFYSIAGLTSSDGGQVKIDGMDVTTMPICLLYTSPSPRDKRQSRMPSSA